MNEKKYKDYTLEDWEELLKDGCFKCSFEEETHKEVAWILLSLTERIYEQEVSND